MKMTCIEFLLFIISLFIVYTRFVVDQDEFEDNKKLE